MQQTDLGLNLSTKKTRKREFLEQMQLVVPWRDLVEAATSYRHESQQIGSLTWWRESEENWVSWLGEMSLRAHQVTASANEPPYWHFEASGNAPTLEEAALLASMRHA